MNTIKPYSGTQAVLRAISLLKVFTDGRPEWGLADLAEEVGLNKTTTYRLLTALESEALLERRSESETYRLGSGIITLGGIALRANDLRVLCQPELKKLAAAAQETASLELLTGAEVFVLDEVYGDRVMSGGQEIGTRWPVHATSSGKVMLAYLSSDELTAVLINPLPTVTPHTIIDHDVLLMELAQIRQRGYAVADEELEIGLVAIAAPLFNYDNQAVAAISLAGPKSRLSPDWLADISPTILAASQRISKHLGSVRK